MTDLHPPPGDCPSPEGGTREKDDKVDYEATKADETVRQKSLSTQECSNLTQLQSDRDRLQQKHRETLDAILALRQRAREKALTAESTRQPIKQAEIDFWRRGIKERQAELMRLQAAIGETNKALRACRDRAETHHNGERKRQLSRGDAPEERLLYLECFRQIVEGSVDPRQYKAFADGARSLAADHRRMNQGGG
jgi:hypothetical protein